MDGLAVEQYRTGAAVAGIAAFLHAEMAELAQEGAQALPSAGVLREAFAVYLECHASSLRISSANLSVMCLRQNGLPWTSS